MVHLGLVDRFLVSLVTIGLPLGYIAGEDLMDESRSQTLHDNPSELDGGVSEGAIIDRAIMEHWLSLAEGNWSPRHHSPTHLLLVSYLKACPADVNNVT